MDVSVGDDAVEGQIEAEFERAATAHVMLKVFGALFVGADHPFRPKLTVGAYPRVFFLSRNFSVFWPL